MKHQCMVPSIALSESEYDPYDAATLASKFALKIIEHPIIRDYLEATHGVPEEFLPHVPNDEDWWDTVDKDSYAKVLAKRHRKPDYQYWMDVKRLKMPDLSTFDGPAVLGFGIRPPPIEYPIRKQGRREIYEIKPHNDRGLKDAQDKLAAVEQSYGDAGLGDVYRRGRVYPFATTKRIDLKSRFQKIFTYLMNLFLASLKVKVSGIYIELHRPEAGVLLYKFCVDLEGMENASREEVRVVASFAIRILSELNTLGERPQIQAAVKSIALSLVPDELPYKSPQEVRWLYAGHDFRTTPYLQIRSVRIADELAPQLNGIRDTMYSRLIGVPGERYFICADKNWYRANIELPGRIRARQVARIVSANEIVRPVHGSNLLGVAPTIMLTAKELLLEVPLVGDVLRWITEHLGTVLIIIAVTVLVTGLILVTAGAATPLVAAAVPVAGELGVGAAAGGFVAVESGLMAAPVMAATTGVEVAGLAAAPVATAATSSAAVVGGETVAAADLLSLTRTLLSTPVTAGEAGLANAGTLADNILIRAMTSPPVQAALKTGAQHAAKATIPAVMAVIGLCPSRAFAYSGPTAGPVQAAGVQQQESIDLGVGQLSVLRVPKYLPYPMAKPPDLYAEFEADAFAGAIGEPFKPNATKIGKMYMMGEFEVI
jgi:hypothetical protein